MDQDIREIATDDELTYMQLLSENIWKYQFNHAIDCQGEPQPYCGSTKEGAWLLLDIAETNLFLLPHIISRILRESSAQNIVLISPDRHPAERRVLSIRRGLTYH